MDIVNALIKLKPGASWELNGDSYEGLIWKDTEQTKPTEAELIAECDRFQSEQDATKYQRLRAKEYPPITEQLDALWKGGDAAAEMLAKVQAVKNKYPKGAE
jgi:hypothetical protein